MVGILLPKMEEREDMTPYEMMMHERNKVTCSNCEYYFRDDKTRNVAENTDHVNYCKNSGKIILEMHVNTENIFRDCFVKKGTGLAKILQSESEDGI